MKFLKKVLEIVLGVLARMTLRRFKPVIVGVTGSVGKTSAKAAIAAVLGSRFRVQAAPGNLNSELGLPLTILNDFDGESWTLVTRSTSFHEKRLEKAAFWASLILKSFRRLLSGPRDSYPEILVLEYGVDKPGDMAALLRVAVPGMGVVTGLGTVPAHVEFFSDPAEVVKEKAKMIQAMSPESWSILSADDARFDELRQCAPGKVISFGFEERADVRIVEFKDHIGTDVPIHVTFKIGYKGSMVPAHIGGAIGRPVAYAAGAAVCAGIACGMNILESIESLHGFKPTSHRMQVLEGEHGLVIDDAYNASPLSVREALRVLESFSGKRTVVLGDMLELGIYSKEAHEKAGEEAGLSADTLVFVGQYREAYREGALKSGMVPDRVFTFPDVEHAVQKVKEIASDSDIVLVKGSWAVGLERVVDILTNKAEV